MPPRRFDDIPSPLPTLPVLPRPPRPSGAQFALLAQLHAQWGPILRVTTDTADGPVTRVWLADPRAIGDVLSDDSDLWRKGPTTFEPFRSLVPQHLISLEGAQSRRLRGAAQRCLGEHLQPRLLDVACAAAVRLARSLETPPGSGGATEVGPQFDVLVRRAALEIVSEAVFGERWSGDFDSDPLAGALAATMHELHWRVTDLGAREWRRDRFAPAPHVGEILGRLEGEIDRQIDLHRSGGGPPSMLKTWCADRELGLGRDELHALCMTFLTMGHENVSTAVAWTVVLLAEHPAQQELVRREVRELRRANPGDSGWTADALSQMRELTDAFHEATRLYPSVPVLTRMPAREAELLGFAIPAGQEVVLNTYAAHRDTSVYGPRASKWQLPESRPTVSARGPPDAFPFGAGARSCIGRPLSYLEARAIVAELLLRFRVVSVPLRAAAEGTPAPAVRPANFVSLRPGPHKLRFEPLGSESRL